MSPLLTSAFLLVFIAFASAGVQNRDICVGCKCCAASLITISASGDEGVQPFDSDVINSAGVCAVRTFTCTGENANIEINGGKNGVIEDTTFKVTCNTEGSAWEASRIAITQVECSSSKNVE